eukprot:jgi/Mesvir1/5165/Mv15303-RA.1
MASAMSARVCVDRVTFAALSKGTASKNTARNPPTCLPALARPKAFLPPRQLKLGSKAPLSSSSYFECRKSGSALCQAALATPGGRSLNLDGYDHVGEPIPDDLSMSDVLKTLPKEVFEISELKSWRSVLITVTALALGYAALAVAPLWAYPLIYIYLGTAATGCFVIGHDCGHNSFSKYPLVNDIVGTIMFAPLIFPFEPWRIKHNVHHAHTNKLIIDTAWQPFNVERYKEADPVWKFLMWATFGPFYWIASVGHWLIWHFDLNRFKESEKPKVKVSLAAVYAFIGLVLVPLTIQTGIVGLVKWWLIPFLGFHFWMSTFTMIHHTAPHIPFKPPKDWNMVQAQLGGTVHCTFPWWVDFLCHDISWHVGHHLSTKIPSYNLRAAYESLDKNWGKHINTCKWGFPLLSNILSQCNLWDDTKGGYVTIKEVEEQAKLPAASN